MASSTESSSPSILLNTPDIDTPEEDVITQRPLVSSPDGEEQTSRHITPDAAELWDFLAQHTLHPTPSQSSADSLQQDRMSDGSGQNEPAEVIVYGTPDLVGPSAFTNVATFDARDNTFAVLCECIRTEHAWFEEFLLQSVNLIVSTQLRFETLQFAIMRTCAVFADQRHVGRVLPLLFLRDSISWTNAFDRAFYGDEIYQGPFISSGFSRPPPGLAEIIKSASFPTVRATLVCHGKQALRDIPSRDGLVMVMLLISQYFCNQITSICSDLQYKAD